MDIKIRCRKIIQRWEEGDDPWREHARLYPQCLYVLSVKGKEFVESAATPPSSNNNTTLQQIQRQNHSGPSQPLHLGATQSQEQMLPVQVSEASGITNQMSMLRIDDDMSSPAVQAFRVSFEDVPIEKIREHVARIRLTEGFSYKLSSKDFEPLVRNI
ncbi:baculoviral iap repeat-containing protein 7 [Plakobranchus ocellatus]|uniref:Baculoviral iap repeat-containing protein 7 n=1 Tax=Plakobranchus ocellatus TaxID=259542 RepID=A0AAV3Z0I2_9GAST|nr:baculoviral iap repeat-containing protein 7 [Plakobranchus ocellatus]